MLMTQKEFAKLLDFSFATINRWETGKYVQLLKQEENCNYILKSIILRWMRYPQFFATRAFLKRFEQPEKMVLFGILKVQARLL